mgnify:CR=1 FL=1
MSKVLVYEVARELGMNAKELVALFQSLGVSEVRNHMSAVGQDAVERVKRRIVVTIIRSGTSQRLPRTALRG